MDNIIKAAIKHKEEQLMGENMVYSRSWEVVENMMDQNESKFKKVLTRMFKKKFLIYFGEAAAVLAFVLVLVLIPVISRWNHNQGAGVTPTKNTPDKFSGNEVKEAEKIAMQFGKRLYTVGLKEFDVYNKYENESSEAMLMGAYELHQDFGPLMTDKEFQSLIAARYYIRYTIAAMHKEYTMEVKDLVLSKQFEDKKENKIGFNYEVKIRMIFNKDKSERIEEEYGYIGLIKENGKWKVYSYKLDTPSKYIMNALN